MRPAIEHAKRERRDLPTRIAEIQSALADARREIEQERATATGEARSSVAPEVGRVAAELDRDAELRGERAAGRPDAALLARLGAVPDGADARRIWVSAAGRIEQHRTLWPTSERVLLGPTPSLGDIDYGFTYYEARQAVWRIWTAPSAALVQRLEGLCRSAERDRVAITSMGLARSRRRRPLATLPPTTKTLELHIPELADSRATGATYGRGRWRFCPRSSIGS